MIREWCSKKRSANLRGKNQLEAAGKYPDRTFKHLFVGISKEHKIRRILRLFYWKMKGHTHI